MRPLCSRIVAVSWALLTLVACSPRSAFAQTKEAWQIDLAPLSRT